VKEDVPALAEDVDPEAPPKPPVKLDVPALATAFEAPPPNPGKPPPWPPVNVEVPAFADEVDPEPPPFNKNSQLSFKYL
jgi:hypothetical protein